MRVRKTGGKPRNREEMTIKVKIADGRSKIMALGVKDGITPRLTLPVIVLIIREKVILMIRMFRIRNRSMVRKHRFPKIATGEEEPSTRHQDLGRTIMKSLPMYRMW
jgi:hypothetical protein